MPQDKDEVIEAGKTNTDTPSESAPSNGEALTSDQRNEVPSTDSSKIMTAGQPTDTYGTTSNVNSASSPGSNDQQSGNSNNAQSQATGILATASSSVASAVKTAGEAIDNYGRAGGQALKDAADGTANETLGNVARTAGDALTGAANTTEQVAKGASEQFDKVTSTQ